MLSNPEQSYSLVTALFDCNRLDGSKIHRTLDKYIVHLKWLMNSGQPIVLVTEQHIADMLSTPDNVTVVVLDFQQLPIHDSLKKYGDLSNYVSYISGDAMKSRRRPDYLKCVLSKTYFLKIASERVEVKNYIWIDAGISHNGYISYNDLNIGLQNNIVKDRITMFFINRMWSKESIESNAIMNAAGIVWVPEQLLDNFHNSTMCKLYEYLDKGIIHTEEILYSIYQYCNPELVNAKYSSWKLLRNLNGIVCDWKFIVNKLLYHRKANSWISGKHMLDYMLKSLKETCGDITVNDLKILLFEGQIISYYSGDLELCRDLSAVMSYNINRYPTSLKSVVKNNISSIGVTEENRNTFLKSTHLLLIER